MSVERTIADRDHSRADTYSLHHHVTGNLEENVKGKEDGETCRVLRGREAQIRGETEQVGVTDVGTIQKGKQVEQRQPRDDP